MQSTYCQNFRACGELKGNFNTPSRTRPPVGPRLVVPTHCGGSQLLPTFNDLKSSDPAGVGPSSSGVEVSSVRAPVRCPRVSKSKTLPVIQFTRHNTPTRKRSHQAQDIHSQQSSQVKAQQTDKANEHTKLGGQPVLCVEPSNSQHDRGGAFSTLSGDSPPSRRHSQSERTE